jgi:hypothetical protein
MGHGWVDGGMITLHNAVVPFDGDEIVIGESETIKDYTVDHSQPSGDCTRVELDGGTVYLVTESIDEIEAMIRK